MFFQEMVEVLFKSFQQGNLSLFVQGKMTWFIYDIYDEEKRDDMAVLLMDIQTF